MDAFHIPGGRRTPEITFDPVTHCHSLAGESFPEDTASFYEPVFDWLEAYLKDVPAGQTVAFNIAVPYFNSSSAKILMDLFSLLEETSEGGAEIVVNWLYDADDEATLEYGEEFAEEVSAFTFNMVARSD